MSSAALRPTALRLRLAQSLLATGAPLAFWMGIIGQWPVAALLGTLAGAAGGWMLAYRAYEAKLGGLEQAAAAASRDLALLGERFDVATRESEESRLACRAKSSFLASMSHELRTPLNAILGYTYLLEEDAEGRGDAVAGADLNRIKTSGHQLLHLIDDLLDLSTIEAGSQGGDRRVIETEALLATLDEDSGLGPLERIIEERAALFVGDPLATGKCLRQLHRLVAADGQAARLAVTREDGTAGRAMIAFHFSPQPGVVALAAPAGDTIGRLAMVQRMALALGGEMMSEMDGARIAGCQLTLPLKSRGKTERIVSTPREAEPAELPSSDADGQAGDKVAVVIDDHRASLDLMRRWLEGDGYRVVSAASGEDGLAAMAGIVPALVVLDIHLPGVSGYDVLEKMRGDERLSGVPVVVVTVDDDRARSLASGADEYLRKPVTRRQLGEVMDVYREPGEGEVLVIDDDDQFAALVDRYAQQVGFTVRRAAGGEEGLAMIAERKPSVIVLDVKMPRVSGIEVIERMLRDKGMDDIPVIVMSAEDIAADDYHRIRESGYRFSTKGSLSPREFAAQLKEMAA